MAKKLIASLEQPFQPELYQDEYQLRLKELIENKIAGKEIVTAQAPKKGNVIDLMDALKKSVEQASGGPARPEPKSRAPRGKKTS